ncbi:MAG: PEP-CTERM sorting domain-containing protein, partial [Verrucomicrobiales bacterium VVV1]
ASQAPGAISVTYNGSYSQNFDTLASSGTANTALPTDWAFSEIGTGANTTYAADTGALTTGNTYSYGGTGSGERALGGLQSNAVAPTFGAVFKNDITGGTTIDLTLSYTGEQWRLGATGRVDRLDFQYSTNATSLTTGTWTDVNALDFTAPVTTGTVGALNGNLTANRVSISSTFTMTIAEGANFWIRWNDFNPTGSDDGLAIDDLSITAVPEPSAALLGGLGLLGLLRRRR